MVRLGWIGLGNMGRGAVRNLVAKSSEITPESPLLIYNRTSARCEQLVASLPPESKSKIRISQSIGDLVKAADIIFSCVGDDSSILSTYETALREGGDVKGKLFVECSTVHPDTTTKLEGMVRAREARMVAGPVFGAPAMADAGQLVFVLAGAAEDIEKVKPYTTGVMGRGVIEFSDEPASKALLLKIVGNSCILNMVEMLAESHTLAEKIGLGTKNLHKFVEHVFPGPYAAYSNRMISGDYMRDEPLFQIDLAIKDCRHMLHLAETSKSVVGNIEVAKKHLDAVKAEMGEKGDLVAIYGAVRKESGLPFDNRPEEYK